MLVLGSLAAAAGCAQALGLGDYREQSASGSDGALDGTYSPETSPFDAQGDNGGNPNDSGTHMDVAKTDATPLIDAPVFGPDAPCTGSASCAPTAPSGWQGPLVIWEGTTGAPSCGGNFQGAFQGGTSLAASPAQCGCTCGTATGAACGPVTLQFATGGCATPCGASSGGLTVGSGPCTTTQSLTSTCGAGAEVTVTGSVGSGATCRPNASTTVPSWTWGMQAVACSPLWQSAAGGCSANELCVPSPPVPFETRYCISKAGNNSCPSGPYSAGHLYYGGVADGRTCTTCTCSTPSIDCNTNAHVALWGNPMCTMNMQADLTPLPASCTATSAHGIQFTTTPIVGSCTPTGGQATGAASEQSLTTFCCMP
jgi:hypothetical protein